MHKDPLCKKSCDFCGVDFYRDKRNTWSHWAKSRFCSRSCSASYGATKKQSKTPTLASAFWAKVKKSGPDECWKWTGCSDKDGYALLSFRKKQLRASRVAIVVSGKQIKENQHACHSCGNSWCCNPAHIYAGTPMQNNSDKKGHGTHMAGSSIYCAKLCEADIPAIRSSSMSHSRLGQAYGVSASAISHVKSRKTWKHVP